VRRPQAVTPARGARRAPSRFRAVRQLHLPRGDLFGRPDDTGRQVVQRVDHIRGTGLHHFVDTHGRVGPEPTPTLFLRRLGLAPPAAIIFG